MNPLHVSPAALRAIEEHARRDAPNECCGLLLGTTGSIVEAVPTRNIADNPSRRYLIDPTDHFAALRRARRAGSDVVGAYHSHPLGPAVPSEADRAEAFEEFLFLIISLASQPPELTAWRWADGNFTLVSLVGTR